MKNILVLLVILFTFVAFCGAADQSSEKLFDREIISRLAAVSSRANQADIDRLSTLAEKSNANFARNYFIGAIQSSDGSMMSFIYRSHSKNILVHFDSCGVVEFNNSSNMIVINKKKNGRPDPEGCFQQVVEWDGKQLNDKTPSLHADHKR
jgi:hypothetical protein